MAVALLFASLWQQRSGFFDALARIDSTAVGFSGGLAVLALVASMLSWRALLHGMGHELPPPIAARLYFLTQIGKYVPGSIWPVVAQIDLGREQGVPAAHSGVAGVLNLLIAIATGAAVGVFSLLVNEGFPGQYWWIGLAALLMLLGLRPKVVSKTTLILLRLARRPVQEFPLRGRAMAVAALWLLLMWLLFGFHLHVLVAALAPSADVVRSVGAYALAWVIGFIVFFAPAGVGAREFSLVFLLTPALGSPEALAVAVVSRVLGIVADALVALLGIAAEKAHRRQAVRASE